MALVSCSESPFCLDFNFYLIKSSEVRMFISYNLILLLETTSPINQCRNSIFINLLHLTSKCIFIVLKIQS